MTDPAGRPGRRGPAVRRAVGSFIVAALLAAAPACSGNGNGNGNGTDGGPSGGGPAPDATGATTGTGGGGSAEPGGPDGAAAPGGSGSTIAGPTPADDVWDVPDRAVPGLGDPRIDVHHYDVTLRADPGEDDIAGHAIVALAARTAEPLASFTLDLRGPTVRSVSVGGEPAEADHRGDQVVITPTTPLEPGELTTVELTYAGHPELGELMGLGIDTGLQHDDRGGWFAMSQPDGTRTWMPANDHPSDKATWRITLDTPAEVVGVANGRLHSSDRRGDRRRWVWEMDQPMATYLAVVAIGDYDLVERDGPYGTRVVSAFPRDLDDDVRASFDRLDDLVVRFAEIYGAYPDDDLGVIVVPTNLGVALETQTRPLFGLDSAGDEVILAHELAHLWAGDSVTPASWEHLWLSEGFATFASGDVRPPFGGTSVAVASPDAARAMGDALYRGGATALLALRDEVGDERFDAILLAWFDRFGGATATTEDFVDLAEELTATDLTDWATTWLHEPQPTYQGG